MSGSWPLAKRSSVSVRAMQLGERLDLKALRKSALATSPLVTTHGDGVVVLFRYGVVVSFGISNLDEANLVHSLANFVSGQLEGTDEERLTVLVDSTRDERAEGNTIIVHELSIERVQIIADALAKSVVLAHHEAAVGRVFDQVEPLITSLGGKAGRLPGTQQLLGYVGQCFRLQTDIVGRIGVADKPDVLWEQPRLDVFFSRLEDEYELAERNDALERKLALVAKMGESLLEMVRHRHSLRVEWYIVVLILVEIVLTLYQMFA